MKKFITSLLLLCFLIACDNRPRPKKYYTYTCITCKGPGAEGYCTVSNTRILKKYPEYNCSSCWNKYVIERGFIPHTYKGYPAWTRPAKRNAWGVVKELSYTYVLVREYTKGGK